MIRTRFVAEVSSNHHTDLGRCLRFVETAADLGCAAVKFQQFRIEELFAPEALRHDPRLLERRAWELPESFNQRLAGRARERGIAFASTPFYRAAVETLAPLVDFFKVASYQLLWRDLLRDVAATGKPVVLATGMATLDEVRDAVDVLEDAGCADLTLLHCVSSYPTPVGQANLRAIETLRDEFALPVGWSDHSASAEVVLRAVQRFGAELVELHLDLDGEGEEYRGGHCWLPGQVGAVLSALEDERGKPTSLAFHEADGDGRKVPQPSELDERLWRTDPADGLRPLASVRDGLSRRKAA